MTDAVAEAGATAIKGESIKRGLDLNRAECLALAQVALAAALEKSENAEIKRLQILVRDWQDSSEAYRRDFEAARSMPLQDHGGRGIAKLRQIESWLDGEADVDDGIPNTAMRALLEIRQALALLAEEETKP